MTQIRWMYRPTIIALGWGLLLPAAGCNLIFGIVGGESAGRDGAACEVYDGDGITGWQVVGSANIEPLSFHNTGSISAFYDETSNITTVQLDGTAPKYCGVQANVFLAGLPVAGRSYQIVDRAAYDDAISFSEGPNVFIRAGAAGQPDGGDCAMMKLFGSIAGSPGEVTVDSVSGTSFSFTVSDVQLTGLVDAALMSDGQGTIQLDVQGAHADCLQRQ
jgi:hypothetical protein